MTESQLKAFPEFTTLPVYDESDPLASTLATAAGAGYTAVRECLTLREVEECLADPALTPLGGLRARSNGGHVVAAYFGARG